MVIASGMKCQICRNRDAKGVIPFGKKRIRPVYVCNDCAITHCGNVFYDGFPIFHFRSENGQWYFVFIHHEHLVPYFYPTPSPQIAVEAEGEILFKQAPSAEYKEWSEVVCKRVIPYRLITRKRKLR